MECYQRGIITEADTGGLPLEWGDNTMILTLIEMISNRVGFGDILAEGNMRAADIVGQGSGYYAQSMKGQDLFEACRGSNAWCLGAYVSTRGGGHTIGSAMFEQTGAAEDEEKTFRIVGVRDAGNGLTYEGRAELTCYFKVLQRRKLPGDMPV